MTTQGTELEHGLPASLDAERTILGAIMLEPGNLDKVRAKLRPSDFYLTAHQRVVAAMNRIDKAGSVVDIVTVAEELSRRKEIESVGGVAWLSSLTEGLPRRLNVDAYVKIVRDKSAARKGIEACSRAITRFADQSDAAIDVLSAAIRDLETIGDPARDEDHSDVKEFVVETLNEMNREYANRSVAAIPSGNAWFDTKTGGGYRHGKIALVCARPNVGKTAWMNMSVAYNLAAGRPVTVFSLDQEKGEVLKNLVPYFVDVPNIVVNRAYMQTPEQNAAIADGFGRLAEMPLRVHDGEMDVDEICWHIDRECKDGQERLFAVDHATLVSVADIPSIKTRERVNAMSNALMLKIRKKPAALILLCQLKRVPRDYAHKPPIPDDIKESGNLFEDCFHCVILHRGYEEPNEAGKGGRKLSQDAEIFLAKIKTGGSTGSTPAYYNTRKLCFEAEAELCGDEYYA